MTRYDEERVLQRLRYVAHFGGVEQLNRRDAQYPCWVVTAQQIVSEA
ncbi:MAG: hypothetical protein AAFY29_19115 [Pseudomonadota bacterium]